MEVMQTKQKGYGGDVLVFNDRGDSVDAIHRVYTLNSQRRVERLQSGVTSQRRGITNGCINVMPDVYEKLIDCCSNATLVVK